MNLTDFMSGPVADALGWTLLHAFWQGFALVLPTAVLLQLLRNKSSKLRYRLSAFTLLIQLLVSVATFVWYYQPATALVNPTLTESLSVDWQTVAHSLSRQPLSIQPLPWQQQMQQFLENHLNQFVLVYLLGVVLFGVRLAGGWLYLQRLSSTATLPSTTAWTELADTLRSVMNVRAVVQVRESARIAVPMVVNVLKPVLLVPIGLATHLSLSEVEAVLAHELAHIKRHDYTVNLLQSVMDVLYFFHPAIWWLSARVREEREHCCDDLAVIAIGGNGRMLAQALARIEEVRLMQTAHTPALAMALATTRQNLLHRVRRMLGVQTRPSVSNGSLAGLTLATLLLVSISVYAVQQQHEPQPKPKSSNLKSTQRFTGVTSGNRIEYGLLEGRITYVIVNKKQLPKAHVQRLQRQLDQVVSGQLNLDDVKQPDRDILLTVFERTAAFDLGMNALAEGMAHIDYDNIVKTSLDAANAASTFPVDTDDVLKEVEKIDYNNLIGDAMAAVSNLNTSSDSLNKQRGYHKQQPDSLPDKSALDSQLQEALSKLWQDNVALHEQMNQQRQSFEEIFSQIREPLEQRKRLMHERFELQQQASLMRSQLKNPAFLTVKEVLADEIATVEKNLSELKQQIDNLTKMEIRPFISNQIHGQHYERMDSLMNSIRANEGEIIDVQRRLGGDDSSGINSIPKPPKAPNVVLPAIPLPPGPTPRISVKPKPAPVPRPAAPTTPRPAPKPYDN